MSYYLLLLLALGGLTSSQDAYNPKPNPDSVVTISKARFSLLTDHLIRMEWGGSNDAATFAFLNRNLPAIKFTHTKDGDWEVIATSAVTIRYLPSNYTFKHDNLRVSVTVAGQTATWSPIPAKLNSLNGNLMGTIRTLDGQSGAVDLDCYKQARNDLHCQLGLVSRNGYVVVDDTNRPRFDNSDWPWVLNTTFPPASAADCNSVSLDDRQLCGSLGISEFDCVGSGCCYDSGAANLSQKCFYSVSSYRDLYFFGHGHNYKLALKEFIMVSGKIPIPPRYAFGIFYSRYWAYDDMGEMEIVREYEERRIPLDVLVTDMDWHITFYSQSAAGVKDQAGQSIGWTGFTWDDHLFPNPKKFLDWCKFKGLKNTLNLHPASGIQPWEDKYTEMARVMGIDPTSKKYVPFVLSDKKFVTNWLDIVLRSRENEGIDFWWLDWQQGEGFVKIPLANPTILLNYVFFTDPEHWNNTVRPFLLHRWGGLGNHRYQTGFSGDVYPTWDSLNFQVHFTTTATNVGFSYWSHDIGGHLVQPSPELYTRWVQWGALSPIFRTHCTKNANNDRRIWVFPPENYRIMREAILLRSSLVPYTYSNAKYAHDEGLGILRPLYYEFPEASSAYLYSNQYFLGDSIMVAPVTQAMDNVTMLVTKDIWIPEGCFVSWTSGEIVQGERTLVNITFTLSEIPIFIKCGSIIPLRGDDYASLGTTQNIPDSLQLMIFTGNMSIGQGSLYEDDGHSTEYLSDQYTTTTFNYKLDFNAGLFTLTIGSAKGKFKGQPSERSYQIRIPNFSPASSVKISNIDVELPQVPLREGLTSYTTDCWTYDGQSLSLIINIVSKQPVDAPFDITVDFSGYKKFDPYQVSGFSQKTSRLQSMKKLLDDQWGVNTVFQDQYPSLLYANEIPQMITYDPSSIADLMMKFSNYFLAGIKEVSGLSKLNPDVKSRILSTL